MIGGVGVGSGGDVTGLSIGGFGVGSGGTLKWVSIGGLGVGAPRIVGLAVGGAGVGAERIDGVALSAGYLRVDDLTGIGTGAYTRVHGVQRGLTIGLGDASEGRAGGLQALDGFADVDIELTDLRAGPFAIAAFVLVRHSSGPYAMAADGAVSGAELARSGGSWLRSAIPGGTLIGAAGA